MNQENDSKKTMNSALLYSIANIISIIVSMIAIPILTNLLKTEDMGLAVSFNTIKTILSYIVLLSIYTTIDKSILEFKGKKREYLSTIYILSNISLFIFLLIYLLFKNPINNILGLSTNLMLLMFIIIFCTNAFTLYTTYWNFENKSIKNFVVSLLSSPVAQFVSILLVIVMTNNKYIGRIIGIDSFSIILGIIFGISILVNGKFYFNKKYAKYALAICIPIIPHLISQMLLAQSDLVMIKYFTGNSSAGIYSLAYTISTVLYTILLQLLRPWSPWVYRRLDKDDYQNVNNKSKLFIILGFILSIGLMTISPELINIFLNSDYHSAMYIVPPLILGVFFQFIYVFFYDVEYFHKKTKYITISSFGAAALNIVLNLIFIPKFGYMVAGYTTAIGYMFLAFLHYIYMRKIDKRKIYNIKYISLLSIVVILFTLLNILFIDNILIRYLLFIIIFIFIFIKYYKEYLNILKIYLNKNDSLYISKLYKNIGKFIYKFPNLGKYISIFFQYILYLVDKIWRFFNKNKINKNKKIKDKKQVLIIFLYNLGDIVVWLSAAKNYREYYNKDEYEITLICQYAFVDFIKMQNIFDNIVGINLKNHITKLSKRFELYENIMKYDYDYVIQPLGIDAILGSDILLANIVSAKEKITLYETDKWSNIDKIPKISKRVFDKIIKIDNNIYKSQFAINNQFLYKITDIKYKNNIYELKKNKININLPKKYFVVFPSSSSLDRIWPIDRFAEIVKKICNNTMIPLVLCGTKNDETIVDKMVEMIPEVKIYNYVCKTNISELIEILRNASLVITNDTGTYHIALSTKTPVSVIAPSAHYSRFILYGKNSEEYVKPIISKNYKCLDCSYKCIYKNNTNSIWPCLNDISVEEVWDNIKDFVIKLKEK